MRFYTKIDKQIDNYYEVVSIKNSLSKQNFYLKIVVLLVFMFNVFVFIGRIIQYIQNPMTFFWVIFYLTLVCSSLQLLHSLVILFYFVKILFLFFCSISSSISSIVSPFIFLACSKTLVSIKAFWPVLDCVEYDSLLFFSMDCEI